MVVGFVHTIADNPTKRIRFLRWQALRVGGPLREIAQHVEAEPIPLAAAHAAEGLQQLLSVITDRQNVTPADVDRLAGPVTDELRAARESLVNAIGNIDILLNGPLLNRGKVAFGRDRPRLGDARLRHYLCPKVPPLGTLFRIQQTTVNLLDVIA